MQKRTFLKSLLTMTVTSALMPNLVFAQWQPRRPINIIVPYKAGGGTDAFARALSSAAKGLIKVPLVIVNKPGSSGITGAKSAASARPDGSTMMVTSAGSFLLTSMLRDTDVNPLDSFRIVGQIGNLTTSLMVPMDSPFQSLEELVEAAKADPGSLRWGHTGRGGVHHIAGQGFLNSNNISATDVPFKGGSATRAAIIGNQVDFAFAGVQQAAGFEDNLRVLGLNAPERDTIMTQVPTFAELGFEYVNVSSPIILFAPKEADDEIINGMASALEKIVPSEKFAELMLTQGNAPIYKNAAETEKQLQSMKEQAEPIVNSLQ